MESATLTTAPVAAGLVARLRAVPASAWAKAGLALLAAVAVAMFWLYPTYPQYDSLYDMLWAREALHGQALSFAAFRTPTEHPLAILVSLPLVLLGTDGDRVFLFAVLVSFVALCAGLYRLGRLTFGPVVGAVTVVLVCTRFDFPFLAARGYIDIPYLALVVWAAALEVARPRRGVPVLVLLAAASLLRPEAWVLTGLYWLWCAWPATWRRRAGLLALAAVGPVVWAALDWAVTGDPLFSLHHTGDTAEALGRTKGIGAIPGATAGFFAELDKLPVLAGALAGLALAGWLVPRRLVMPLVLFAAGLGTFLAVGLAGLSVIQRYLLAPSLMVMLLCAVAVGGWTILRPGTRLRTAWAVAGALLVVAGAGYSATRVNLSSIESQLAFRGDSRVALATLLDRPPVRRALACGAVSVPTHKLIPDVRWLLDRDQHAVVAREDPSPAARRAARRGVAILVTDRLALVQQVFTDPTVTGLSDLPPAGFRPIATAGMYAAYAGC